MKLVTTGIQGLDELLHGGIPEGHTVVVIEPPGTGKSTLALQFIYEGLQKGEHCVYLSLEENKEGIKQTAESFDWNIAPHIENETLVLTRFTPHNIKNAMERAENEFLNLLKHFNTKRLVIDSITLYEVIQSSQGERRDRLFNLINAIKEARCTTVLTSEIDPSNPHSSRYGLVEYLCDGVIIFQYVQNCDSVTMDTTTSMKVLKMRRIAHSRATKPYSITPNGIVVHTSSEIFV